MTALDPIAWCSLASATDADADAREGGHDAIGIGHHRHPSLICDKTFALLILQHAFLKAWRPVTSDNLVKNLVHYYAYGDSPLSLFLARLSNLSGRSSAGSQDGHPCVFDTAGFTFSQPETKELRAEVREAMLQCHQLLPISLRVWTDNMGGLGPNRHQLQAEERLVDWYERHTYT